MRVPLRLVALFGGAAFLAFLGFLLAGPPGWVDLHLSGPAALAFDAALCLAFFTQHSGMIRKPFRLALARILADEWHGVLYAICAGSALLALVVFWQESGPLVEPPTTVAWLQRAAALAALAGVVWSFRSLPSLDPFGIGPALHRERGTLPRPPRLAARGPYRWARHPMYFLALVLIWSYPHLTADRLLFNILWTTWVWVGTLLEERDLVETFGDGYRRYQRKVPMLIPHRIPGRDVLDDEW